MRSTRARRTRTIPTAEELFHPCEGHPVETIANLDAVPIVECGEPLVRLSPGSGLTLARPMRLREGAAVRLLEAGERAAAAGLAIHLFDAYRHPERQRATHAVARGIVRAIHPAWPRALVRELANKYVATPDALAPPPHTTGGAVDLRLRDARGRAFPMGAPARTAHPGLSYEARTNRARLATLLEPAGFSNYEEEWWHWSYGDSGWALRTGAPHAVYGKAQA